MRFSAASLTPFWLLLLFALGSCAPASRHETVASRSAPASVQPTPLILAVDEGERRNRRFAGNAPGFLIKVDRRNGGSGDLVMGYEDLPPGAAIPPHRHLDMDEIVFVHRGVGMAGLGDREVAVGPGATIYIPKGTRVTLRNTGTEPLSIVFVFPKPGFEEFMRDTSVLEGQPVVPFADGELAAIRKRHASHVVFDKP